jgi:hypothetical protein
MNPLQYEERLRRTLKNNKEEIEKEKIKKQLANNLQKS